MEEVLNILDYNKDGKVDIEDLYDFIIKKMKIVKKKNLSGREKRELVLDEIEKIFGTEVMDTYKPILVEFINFYFRKVMRKCFKCL